jgi:hypothetical protein
MGNKNSTVGASINYTFESRGQKVIRFILGLITIIITVLLALVLPISAALLIGSCCFILFQGLFSWRIHG